ncbi:MAG: M23 family metallopeptidase [Clostridia bacterium]|nr:M23 family metallopeptidase [Clostridia bacterium]
MEDKNKTPEIPENNPPPSDKPISLKADEKGKRKWNYIKLAYAFAIILALGGALFAKIASEKAIGNLNVPIEQDYITLAPTLPAEETVPDFQVRQNKTDVPDTRAEDAVTNTEAQTSEATTKKEYAEPYKGYYTLPLSTDICKEYMADKPSHNPTTNDWRTHPAIDFKGAEGTQIKAISKGTVKRVYKDALLGTVIEIDHGNDVIARYCGINSETVEVKENSKVKQGDTIGYLGTVPFEASEVFHLHFEILYKGEYVDPLALMGK